MFACPACVDTCPKAPATDAGLLGGSRRFFFDPLWNSIQAEGLVEADREPLLRSWIEQAVLSRDSIGDGLAMLLGQRLCGGLSDSSEFYDEFRKVIAEDPAIAESARSDLLAIRANDPAVESLLHPFLNFKGFHSTQAHRVAHAMWMRDRRSLAYFIQNRASEVFGVDIHPGAEIGAGVFLDHGTGVVIGETAIVGNDVTILHGVTLGGTGNESGDRHPKVGNGVFIGASAQLLGNIRIGDGSRIGASSVVLKSVEPHCTVAGIPARVVRKQHESTIPMALDAMPA